MNRRKFLDKSYLGLTTMLVAPETISNLGNKVILIFRKIPKFMLLVLGMLKLKQI